MATILIIEDDPNSVNILTRVLERAGHEVLVATEGLSGVKAISQQRVDLVLLDMGLPDLGGHTVAALIKRVPGEVPVVAVSASTEPATERRAMEYGCVGYITKPINTRTFSEQISIYISRQPSLEPAPSPDTATPVLATDTAPPAPGPDTAAPVPATDTAPPAPSPDTATPVLATDTAPPAPSPDTAPPLPATDTTTPVTSADTAAPVPATDTTRPVISPGTAASVTGLDTKA